MLNASCLVIPPRFGWSVWAYNVYLRGMKSASKTGLSWYSSCAYLFRVYSVYWSNSKCLKHLLAFKILFNCKEGIEDLQIFSKEKKIMLRSLPLNLYCIYVNIYACMCVFMHTEICLIKYFCGISSSGGYLALILQFLLHKQWKWNLSWGMCSCTLLT